MPGKYRYGAIQLIDVSHVFYLAKDEFDIGARSKIGIILFAFVLEFLNTLFLVKLKKSKSTDIKTCAVFVCVCLGVYQWNIVPFNFFDWDLLSCCRQFAAGKPQSCHPPPFPVRSVYRSHWSAVRRIEISRLAWKVPAEGIWNDIWYVWRVGTFKAIVNGTYRSITIGIHQLAQRRVFLDFELDDSIILTQDLQVDMLGFSLKREKLLLYIHTYAEK